MLFIKESLPESGHEALPTLVFIHGLLGSGEDWKDVALHLPEFHRLFIDLPGHGHSVGQKAISFSHCCQQIAQTIRSTLSSERPVVVVGYSLGARLTMYALAKKKFSDVRIVGYMLEGGNIGLTTEEQREERLEHDTQWAKRYKEEPLEQVLSDWYRQSVFSSLNQSQREALIGKRSANQGSAVADMLMATSLAKQPCFRDTLGNHATNVHYICGEKDKKFLQLAKESKLSFTSIAGAGHNVHQERPIEYADLIRTYIRSLENSFS